MSAEVRCQLISHEFIHVLQLLRATTHAGRRPGTENPIRPLSGVPY